MKVGIDIRVLMDEYYSGVSEYTANLLSAIFALDKKNEYKLFYNSWHNLDKRLGIWNGENVTVIARHIPNKIFNYFYQKLLAYPKLDQVLGGVDVFLSPHFNFTCLSRRTKKIITVHDLSFLRYPEFFSARKNFWHRALRVKKNLQTADKIIAVSENTKNDIIELSGVPAEKIRVIYSGNNANAKVEAANESMSEVEAKDFLTNHNLTGRIILYLGTIEPRKNIVGLIKAYNELRDKNELFKDIKLVLAGAHGWKEEKIYKEWRISPYQDDIIFLGYISQKEKDILYKKASVFVYPSYYEGFGFPPLEAMTYGLPVICSNVSSLPEVVADAALMINPFVPEEITTALEMILTDETLRQSLVIKGRARAQFFSWEKTAAEYLEVFKELSC